MHVIYRLIGAFFSPDDSSNNYY